MSFNLGWNELDCYVCSYTGSVSTIYIKQKISRYKIDMANVDVRTIALIAENEYKSEHYPQDE